MRNQKQPNLTNLFAFYFREPHIYTTNTYTYNKKMELATKSQVYNPYIILSDMYNGNWLVSENSVLGYVTGSGMYT